MSSRLGRDPFRKSAKSGQTGPAPSNPKSDPLQLGPDAAAAETQTSLETEPLQMAAVALELARTVGMFTGLFVAHSFLSRGK
ncbi:MAG: hypothetical protein JNL01_09525 [Bdellovibrionales bacterium]|nr:hypothetical protein [Bdellovibrionales bacterium]